MPKVTMQDIANALHTSRITVWKAFNNREGVSQHLKEQILQTAQEMGYNIKADVEPVQSSEKSKNVALVVSRPETSIF